jgi:hypothetical protein
MTKTHYKHVWKCHNQTLTMHNLTYQNKNYFIKKRKAVEKWGMVGKG